MTGYAVPDEGATRDLDWMIRIAFPVDAPIAMRIFVNDIVPQRGATLANFTEATFAGYSQQVISRNQWAAAAIGDDHVARIMLAAGPRMFTPFEGGVTLYGVYLVALPSGPVVFSRRFVPPRVTVAFTPISVMPVVTLRSESYEVP